MTSATHRSRSVPAAVLIASVAASSHEVLLVPMISVTLYTLITRSSDHARPAPRVVVAGLSQSGRRCSQVIAESADADGRRLGCPGLRDIGPAPTTRVLRLPASSSGDDCTANHGQASDSFSLLSGGMCAQPRYASEGSRELGKRSGVG